MITLFFKTYAHPSRACRAILRTFDPLKRHVGRFKLAQGFGCSVGFLRCGPTTERFVPMSLLIAFWSAAFKQNIHHFSCFELYGATRVHANLRAVTLYWLSLTATCERPGRGAPVDDTNKSFSHSRWSHLVRCKSVRRRRVHFLSTIPSCAPLRNSPPHCMGQQKTLRSFSPLQSRVRPVPFVLPLSPFSLSFIVYLSPGSTLTHRSHHNHRTYNMGNRVQVLQMMSISKH